MTLPAAYVFLPIGVLYGVTAVGLGWSWYEVGLTSAIGVSSSAQFALVKFASEKVPFAISLLLISLINIRYVIMAVLLPRQFDKSIILKALASHIITDASFALERPEEQPRARLWIRFYIWAYWVSSSLLGAVIAPLSSRAVMIYLNGFTFPASALLVWFGVDRAVNFIGNKRALSRIAAVLAVALAAFILITTLGRSLFWVPSIALGVWIMWVGSRGKGDV